MKLIQSGTTYTITDITETELETLFHPHNVETFASSLPDKYMQASRNIFDTLSNQAYAGQDLHKQFATAMTNVR